MRLLVTGGRNWTDLSLIRVALWSLYWNYNGNVTLIHGAARGADSLAGLVGKEFGWNIKEFPADWSKFKNAAGPIRNRQMLKETPDLVYAFHDDLKNSRGTKDMVQISIDNAIPVVLFTHDKIWTRNLNHAN